MLTACFDDAGDTNPNPPSSTSTTTTVPPELTTTTRGLTGVSTDFARTVVELNGVLYSVAVADTPEKLAQGLMGVEDLRPLDGMLFVFDGESVRSFWMKDTLIPLDVAFFDADGFLVSTASMATCPDDDCRRYLSEGVAQFALETPHGTLEDLSSDTRLVVVGALDGIGKEI